MLIVYTNFSHIEYCYLISYFSNASDAGKRFLFNGLERHLYYYVASESVITSCIKNDIPQRSGLNRGSYIRRHLI